MEMPPLHLNNQKKNLGEAADSFYVRFRFFGAWHMNDIFPLTNPTRPTRVLLSQPMWSIS